uniref:Uncharacterized protein n=1 Tax=Anguilla anguilla TaxID=7936 RepID=A0A0E9U0D9_ANGAN
MYHRLEYRTKMKTSGYRTMYLGLR